MKEGWLWHTSLQMKHLFLADMSLKFKFNILLYDSALGNNSYLLFLPFLYERCSTNTWEIVLMVRLTIIFAILMKCYSPAYALLIKNSCVSQCICMAFVSSFSGNEFHTDMLNHNCRVWMSTCASTEYTLKNEKNVVCLHQASDLQMQSFH